MSDQEPKKLKRLTPYQAETSNAIKVLYVEDAEVIRDTLSRLLELNGFKVNYAKNGKEGVERRAKGILHRNYPSLVKPAIS